MTSCADDDWAKALALLDRVPPEPEDRRAHRLRLHRRLFLAGTVAATLAVVTLLLLAAIDPGSSRAEVAPAAWRIVLGVGLQVVGLALVITAAVSWSGAVRHTRGWAKPMHWLSRRERAGLLRQARGKDRPVPEQLPLARHTARMLLVQRPPLTSTSALLLLFVGQYAASPDPVRLVLCLGMAVAVALASVHLRRDTERLERFLAAHPAS